MPLLAITGATGFVGRAIVHQARADGYRVRAIVRNPPTMPLDAELFTGNVLDLKTLTNAFAGADAVIHLVGIIRESGDQTFDRIHRQATGNVIAAAQSAGVPRLIHMSALGVRPNARSQYHQTKWAAEEAVRQSGLAWTIFRPSLIYGPGNQSISVLEKIVRLAPVIPVLGDGRSKIQPVSVATVAKCFIAAVNQPSAVEKTYDLCGPVTFTWNELYDKLLAAQNRRKPKFHILSIVVNGSGNVTVSGTLTIGSITVASGLQAVGGNQGTTTTITLPGIVPPGVTYSVTTNNASITSWSELY